MNLFYLEEIDSTNKYAKEHITELTDKTVVYTYNQTNGRGRLDRRWNNMGEDNIYASIVLKPSDTMQEVYSNLTQYLCVVLAKTFEEYGVEPKIKWPNDIQINGKKISGILAEACISKNKLQGLVLGFGVNLNTKKELLDKISQPATSLDIETGEKIDKKNFLKKLLANFCLMYDEFIYRGFSLIKEDYMRMVCFLNKEIKVKVFDKEVCGVAADITENGALKIINNGQEKILLMGDII